jgi:hypothetical protein
MLGYPGALRDRWIWDAAKAMTAQNWRSNIRSGCKGSAIARQDPAVPTALHPYVVLRCAAMLLVGYPAWSAHAQGTVVGSVIDEMQRPIHDAEVRIEKLGILTRTDSVGRFTLRGVPRGEQRVIIRRLGYAPKMVDVGVAAGDSVIVQIVLLQRAQVLPAIPVAGAENPIVPRRLRDFERRRTSGVGHFLTADDIAVERSKPLGDVLVRLPGTLVVRSSLTACLVLTRGAQSFRNSASGYCGNKLVGGHNCPVAVFLDGFPAYNGHSEEIFDLNSLSANVVAGVEFYSGASSMPREFSAPRGTCGAVVIWTK